MKVIAYIRRFFIPFAVIACPLLLNLQHLPANAAEASFGVNAGASTAAVSTAENGVANKNTHICAPRVQLNDNQGFGLARSQRFARFNFYVNSSTTGADPAVLLSEPAFCGDACIQWAGCRHLFGGTAFNITPITSSRSASASSWQTDGQVGRQTVSDSLMAADQTVEQVDETVGAVDETVEQVDETVIFSQGIRYAVSPIVSISGKLGFDLILAWDGLRVVRKVNSTNPGVAAIAVSLGIAGRWHQQVRDLNLERLVQNYLVTGQIHLRTELQFYGTESEKYFAITPFIYAGLGGCDFAFLTTCIDSGIGIGFYGRHLGFFLAYDNFYIYGEQKVFVPQDPLAVRVGIELTFPIY